MDLFTYFNPSTYPDFQKEFAYIFMPVMYYGYFWGVSRVIQSLLKNSLIQHNELKVPVSTWVASVVVLIIIAYFTAFEYSRHINYTHILKNFLLLLVPFWDACYKTNKRIRSMSDIDKMNHRVNTKMGRGSSEW